MVCPQKKWSNSLFQLTKLTALYCCFLWFEPLLHDDNVFEVNKSNLRITSFHQPIKEA